jgi:hypothetical protein
VRLQDSHLGIPREKSHLDVGFVANHKVLYKGEGGGFPQVWAVVSLVCPCCPWLVLAPKVFQLCINHFVWVVCRPMWVSEACQLFLVPSRSSNMPFYPSKRCELRSVPRPLPLLLGLTFESFKELGIHQAIEFWPLKSLSEILWVHWDSISQSGSCIGNVKVHFLILLHIFLHSWEYVMWLPGFFLAHTLATSFDVLPSH